MWKLLFFLLPDATMDIRSQTWTFVLTGSQLKKLSLELSH